MTAQEIHPTPLSERLRDQTSTEHRALEVGLGFDLHRPELPVALAMLRGFYGVLRELEPAILALVPPALQDRGKLELLRKDLQTLGHDADQLGAIPSPANAWRPDTTAQAMGALYVMEGSTLGGKQITKALRRLPDWPISGPSYFDPYGPETGSRWSAFRVYLDNLHPTQGDDVVAAARRTFALLSQWMVETKA